MNDAFELNTIYVVADKLECNCFSEYIVFFSQEGDTRASLRVVQRYRVCFV